MLNNSPYTEEKLDFDKLFLMFKETRELIEKNSLEHERMYQEHDKMSKDTDKKFQETDKKFQDTDKKFQETDKKLNKLEYLFTSQWGKLVESLVEGDLVRLLNEKGVNVHDTTTRSKNLYNNKIYEFDIIAENGEEIVVVEVKTTLTPRDINEFLAKLKEFKNIKPKYADNTIYGAVAYLKTDSNCETMAEKKGLFIIRATGNSASITNSNDFRPKKF